MYKVTISQIFLYKSLKPLLMLIFHKQFRDIILQKHINKNFTVIAMKNMYKNIYSYLCF